MSKIGDLFIHLGIKKDNLTKGLDQAKKEVNGFGKTLGKIKGWAATMWAAVGAMAFAAADKFAHTSQRFGDAWDNTTAKMKGAWNEFIRSLNTWDWENFGKRIKGAMSMAGEVQKSDDLEAEVRRSIQLKKDEQQGILNQDLITMRNMQKSYAEREAAAKDYLKRMGDIYDQEYLYRKGNADVKMKQYLGAAGLDFSDANVSALKNFITTIAPNENLLDSYVASFNKGSNNPLAKIANLYKNQSADADIEVVTRALHAAAVAQNALESENQRVYSTLNSLGAKMEESGKTTDENAEATQKLAAARELLNDKLEKGISITDKSAGMKTATPMGNLAPMQQADYSEQIEWFERVQAASEELAYSLEDGLIGALDELANAFAGVDGADFGSVVKALLGPLADAAVKAGAIIMFSGEAMDQLKKAFANPFGGGAAGAIVAGGALMAIGVAAKAGLAAIGKGGGSAGTATSSAAASGQGMTQTQYEDMNINVKIEGKLKGSDIVLASRGAQASWAR